MVRPKKHLGQHFLTDQHTALKIVDAIDYHSGLNLLEIGPGKGVLTDHILKKADINFKVIEIDDESVEYLKSQYDTIDLISSDILKLDFQSLFNGASFNIIGNFPYNISSQILFKMLDNMLEVDELVGMFQKEMAQRVCSVHDNKIYGLLSVLIQAYYDVEYLFTVNEGVFFPPPKVKSGVIRLKRKSDLPNKISYKVFKSMIKSAFGQRRKQLRNTLKSFFPPGYDNALLLKRPEQLSWNDLYDLCTDIHNSH